MSFPARRRDRPAPTDVTLAADVNVAKVSGTVQTARNWSTDLSKLDVALSTRASETELAKKVNRATTPTIYTVTMTNANTEYNQPLPANTKKFTIHTRDGTTFRLAFVTGKVATPTEPYWTVLANVTYFEDFIEPSSLTLYFACGTAGKVAEIIAWS